jgi:uncharacterized protein
MADDCVWILKGRSAWAKTYRGKAAIRRDLMAPLYAQFATRYSAQATRFTADEDRVVVESRGNVVTHAGKAYDNEYCFVFRLESGKICEITEYMDTALLSVLTDPVPV